jgi:hypothetical protein
MKQLCYTVVSKFCDRLGKACLSIACLHQMGMSPQETNRFILEGVYPGEEEAPCTSDPARLKDGKQ